MIIDKSCTTKHRHRYKTVVIDSRGWKHQKCKCGKHRVLDDAGKMVKNIFIKFEMKKEI